MPNMFGGDQLDEDYAPHLWKNGRYVGLSDEEKKSRQEAIELFRKVQEKKRYVIRNGIITLKEEIV